MTKLTAHHTIEPATDREPKANLTIRGSGRCLGLRKHLKQQRNLLGRPDPGVGYREPDPGRGHRPACSGAISRVSGPCPAKLRSFDRAAPSLARACDECRAL